MQIRSDRLCLRNKYLLRLFLLQILYFDYEYVLDVCALLKRLDPPPTRLSAETRRFGDIFGNPRKIERRRILAWHIIRKRNEKYIYTIYYAKERVKSRNGGRRDGKERESVTRTRSALSSPRAAWRDIDCRRVGAPLPLVAAPRARRCRAVRQSADSSYPTHSWSDARRRCNHRRIAALAPYSLSLSSLLHSSFVFTPRNELAFFLLLYPLRTQLALILGTPRKAAVIYVGFNAPRMKFLLHPQVALWIVDKRMNIKVSH